MTHLEYNGYEYAITQDQPPYNENYWWRDLSVIAPETALQEYEERFGENTGKLYSFTVLKKSWLALGPVDEGAIKAVFV